MTTVFMSFVNMSSGKVFVHEWAKFRYGLFEEYGYPGDDIYPMFYYDQNLNTPKVQTSYPTGNINTGIKIRFNLAGVQ